MTQIAERCVLFADLRGSTALFESLGNAAATAVVTQCVLALQRAIPSESGRVIKTLGDGLMAVFPVAADAVRSAMQMHEALEQVMQSARRQGAMISLEDLRLQVGIARGEVVELQGDCFGDAVNVAARLLDHAGDNETLATAEVLAGLPAMLCERFRSLDRIALRGRTEPVQVFVRAARRPTDTVVTQFSSMPSDLDEPNTLRLRWNGQSGVFGLGELPVIIGRSPQVSFVVDESRVSRSHARVDWHGGSFQLSDLSFNGTYVQFADGEIVSLRRGSCLLHGSGMIGLGGAPNEPKSALLEFDISHRDVSARP
jgi:adenylate cyclase